ncbi:hypothetical protein ACQKWADRAFT_330221 [Trichoderma austrokoningii]
MARTKEDAKAANNNNNNNNASTDITHQATEDAGVKKTPGRGRGRPKGAASKSPAKPYVPTGKPRGRPKGSVKKGSQAKAKAPKKVLPPLAPGEKRRGRPRKSDVAQTHNDDDEDDQAATAESEANVEDDAASNQPGIGKTDHSRDSQFSLVDVAGDDARSGAGSALTPRQSPEYEVGPSSSFSSPAWLSRFKSIVSRT